MREYITLDLETTGLSPERNEIIQIGAWHIKDSVAVDKFDCYVKPIMYIPLEVQSITGITMDKVADAEPIEVVLPEFFDWCGDLPFLGHNIDFDYRFLCVKGKPLGLDFTLKRARQGVDTLSLARKNLSLKHNKLEDVAKHFHILLESDKGYHDACYDAMMCKLIFDRFQFSAGYEILPELLAKDDIKYGEAVDSGTLDFV